MNTFSRFVREASFNVNASRRTGLPKTNTFQQNMYPVQTGQANPFNNLLNLMPQARQTISPQAPAAAQPSFATAPTVTQRNVTTSTYPTQTTVPTQTQQTSLGKNGQLTPKELKPVGKYNAGPSGARQWYGNTALLNPRAADAFLAAQQAYGQQIPINSAYRNLEHQKGLSGEGHKVVGRAGTSRHGLGAAIDVQPNTPAYNWLTRNGPQFGWYFASIPGDPYHFEFRG
jgi:LAS superfamily LD-carboxypeptidase LdcB